MSVRTVGGGGTTVVSTGGVNFRPAQTPGVAITKMLLVVKPPQTPGVVLSQAPLTARVAETPGLVLSNRVSGAPTKTVEIPGMDIVHTKVDLTHLSASNAVVQTAVGGRTDWTTIANATGAPDSDNALPPIAPTNCAAFVGNALVTTGGRVEMSYADFANKSSLTITSVELRFYVRQTGTALNNGNLILAYDIGAGAVTLETITGDVNSIGTPRTFSIPATTWTHLDAIKAYVSHSLAAGAAQALISAHIDAVELRIVATKTDIQ